MIVLGFNHGGHEQAETPYGHDASAALVRDGEIIAAAEEERFSRVKHTSLFPTNAIRYCLDEAGATLADVDMFCFPWSPPLDRRNMVRAEVELSLILLRHSVRQHMHAALFQDFTTHFDFVVPEDRRRCLPHHLCHAASAFFCSSFDQAAFLVIDAYGEMVSVSYGAAAGGALHPLGEVLLPSTLGGFYQSYTHLLGFRGKGDEYKVMGLAAYGSPDRFRSLLRRQWRPTADGLEQVNDEVSRAAVAELYPLRRRPDEPITTDHQDLAAAVQESLDEQVLHLAKLVRDRTEQADLCLAGGVALNSTANGKLARSGLFRRLFVQPAANDAGVALGAALLEAARRTVPRPRTFSAYLGPGYERGDVDAACDRAHHEIRVQEPDDPDDLIEATVQRLVRQQVIGWFQGRMEFGPRALGNRSILADPRHEGMRDRVNQAVKHREAFRPFAPAVVAEAAERYFDLSGQGESPFMLMTLPVHEIRRSEIAAVVHRDQTARVQTVTRNQNPLFWRLLTRFGERTGVPVLMNTSFNINGEPIVCTPGDALECFLSTDMDALVLGHRLIERRPLDTDLLLGLCPRVQRGLRVESTLGVSDAEPTLEWKHIWLQRRHLRASLLEAQATLLFACDGARPLAEIVDALCGPFGDLHERRVAQETAAEIVRFLLRHRFVSLVGQG